MNKYKRLILIKYDDEDNENNKCGGLEPSERLIQYLIMDEKYISHLSRTVDESIKFLNNFPRCLFLCSKYFGSYIKHFYKQTVIWIKFSHSE